MNRPSIRERIDGRNEVAPRDSSVPLRLGEKEVHCWLIGLNGGAAGWYSEGLLSDEERAKADKFKRAADRDRYIRSHAALRIILGRYLGKAAPEIAFDQEPFGKPIIPAELNRLNLSFNLAHSGDFALVGATQGRRVGVDIEYWRPEAIERGVMQRFCSPVERERIERATDAERVAEFFACWTRKEAYLKAVGCGLVDEVCSVEMGLAKPEAGKMHGVRRAGSVLKPLPAKIDSAQRWTVYDLEAPQNYSAALAVEGAETLQIAQFEWMERG